ncbi:hypothetical protein SAMN04488587_0622 [Methanococcoides vulcani]|uniref:Uncharacterized protein n=1 Tax=Methanococcoides vulcani TaxID=1353158 RepID=A0A1H9YJR9_9EURY|nr:hypothetical protein [Methanococcoides vulcani]SES69289.1 hypothetical protein SAMN04488587_0622 [Methanococcoides vulcani]
MGWFDVVAGVCTGGLYTAGKAIYQAGNAAESAGNAAEEAGLALAVIGSTIEAVGEQLESTLKEAEELLTIRRMTPRDEDDLWDEEKDRLNALRQEETRLKNKLAEMGVEDVTDFSFDFWDMLSNMQDVIKKFQIMARLASVRKEIHDIFYQEPGVLANGIYNAKEALERFNTIEQPMIEDILDSLDDNLEVSEEVLKEIKKLFVTKRKVPVSIADLSPSVQGQLEMIRKDKQYYEGLIARKDTVTSQLANVIELFPEKKFDINMGSISIAGANIHAGDIVKEGPYVEDIATERPHRDDFVREGTRAEDIARERVHAEDIREEETHRTDIERANTAIRHERITDNGFIEEEEPHRAEIERTGTAIRHEKITDDHFIRRAERTSGTDIDREISRDMAVEEREMRTAAATYTPEIAKPSMEAISKMKMAVAKGPKYSMMSMQPHGAIISASLSTKFDGYQRNYDLLKAQKTFYYRQSLKLERKYELLSNKWVEEPGIIPKTLDELHGVLKNVRTEEQPRIDQLLDNLNANLTESQETLSKANDTMDSIQNALSILDMDTGKIKMGAMVIGGLIVLNLFVGLIVLIRMALGY